MASSGGGIEESVGNIVSPTCMFSAPTVKAGLITRDRRDGCIHPGVSFNPIREMSEGTAVHRNAASHRRDGLSSVVHRRDYSISECDGRDLRHQGRNRLYA